MEKVPKFRAWFDGYNIEEQKYIVAIPDGRGDGGVVQLWKGLEGDLLLNFQKKLELVTYTS